jgi:hypothetical protein
VMMHLGIAFTMIIPAFSTLMILSYLLFLDDTALKTLVNFPQLVRAKFSSQNVKV